jgi:hypothetical protein
MWSSISTLLRQTEGCPRSWTPLCRRGGQRNREKEAAGEAGDMEDVDLWDLAIMLKLFAIGKMLGCFAWLPKPRQFDKNELYTMNVHETLRVHVTTHFSDSISDKHIAAIKKVILPDRCI